MSITEIRQQTPPQLWAYLARYWSPHPGFPDPRPQPRSVAAPNTPPLNHHLLSYCHCHSRSCHHCHSSSCHTVIDTAVIKVTVCAGQCCHCHDAIHHPVTTVLLFRGHLQQTRIGCGQKEGKLCTVGVEALDTGH